MRVQTDKQTHHHCVTHGRCSYSPYAYSEIVIDFMKQAVKDEVPFFAYYPMILTHNPFRTESLPPASREGVFTKTDAYVAMVEVKR